MTTVEVPPPALNAQSAESALGDQSIVVLSDLSSTSTTFRAHTGEFPAFVRVVRGAIQPNVNYFSVTLETVSGALQDRIKHANRLFRRNV